MVAPTGVNEGTPQEPVTAESPGPATARLTQAEVVTEDPAGPADEDREEPSGNLKETAPAAAEPTGSAATEPVPAEVVPAQAVPIEAEPAETEPAEPQPTETGPAEPEPTEAGPAAAEPAQAGNAEAGLVEAEAAAAAPAESELTTAEPTGKEPGEKEPGEKGLAEAGEPGLADGQEHRAAEAQEASRDVGPLAVIGIIVGVVALVGVAAGVLAMVTHGFKPKTVVMYRPAAVFGLRPGQCVNAGSNSLSFTLVSCASPHDAEVFARFSLPAAAWPGSSAVRQEAGDGCASRLSGYLNPRLASIGLTQEYVYPNRDAWEASQRTVVCEVSSGSGRLTGSVRAKT
jgi:putative regulator of septum formation